MKGFCGVLVPYCLAAVLLTASSEDAILQEAKLTANISDVAINITQSFLNTLPSSLTLNSSSNVTLDYEHVQGTFNLSDLVIDGLNQTNIVFMYMDYNVIFNPSIFNTTIELKGLNVLLPYMADLNIMTFFPLFGNGLIRISIESLILKLYIETKNGIITINSFQNLSLLMQVGNNSKFQIDGVMNDPAMSGVLSDVGSNLLVKSINQLDQYLGNISQNVSATLQEALNKLCPITIN